MSALAAIDEYKVTITAMPVDGAVELMDHPRFKEFNLSSLKQIRVVSFVKKLNPEYRRRWKELTGTILAESSWGMTETHTSNTFTTGFQDNDFDLTSQPIFVGLPVPGAEFKITDFETGDLIPIEERDASEVRAPFGNAIVPEDYPARNPAFDVTPHRYVTGIVTENGIVYPPFDLNLRRAVAGPLT